MEIGDWRLKEEMSILRFFAQISRPSSSLLFSFFPLAFSFYYFSLLLQYLYFCTFILKYFIKNLWRKKNNVKDFSPVEPVVGTQLVFFSFGLLGTAGERDSSVRCSAWPQSHRQLLASIFSLNSFFFFLFYY